jgi:hypothetical protein
VDNATGTAASQPGPVRRLTFRYDGDRIELVSDQTVTMTVPRPQPADVAPPHGALSLVMRDDQDQPLAQVTHVSPIAHDAEVFAPPGESPQRVPVAQPKGAFTILVPDVPGAQKIELIGPPLKPDAHLEPPQHLGTFPLRPPGGE